MIGVNALVEHKADYVPEIRSLSIAVLKLNRARDVGIF